METGARIKENLNNTPAQETSTFQNDAGYDTQPEEINDILNTNKNNLPQSNGTMRFSGKVQIRKHSESSFDGNSISNSSPPIDEFGTPNMVTKTEDKSKTDFSAYDTSSESQTIPTEQETL